MKTKMRIVTVLLLMALIIMSAALMTSCKESASGNDDEHFAKDKNSVAGRCYVLSGMSSEEGEYDEALIKEMFDIEELSEYMSIYFGRDGKARISSLLYGDDVLEGEYTEKGNQITVDMGKLDDMAITRESDGQLKTVYVDDDGYFPLTFKETEDIPELLKDAAGK